MLLRYVAEATGTAREEVIARAGVATELREHIGDADCIIDQTVVTTVVEGACVTEFQTCECQTGFVAVLCIATFRVVTLGSYIPTDRSQSADR